MKCFILFLLLLFSNLSDAQNISLLEDSLTLGNQRTWVTENSEKFTKLGGSCSGYGIEIIFHKKGKLADLFLCENGLWTESNYEFEVVQKNGEHLIKLFYMDNSFLFFFKRRREVEDKKMHIKLNSLPNGDLLTEIDLLWFIGKSTGKLKGKIG